jgi:Secretion system C-terminal sorting domain/Reeler domain
MFKNTIIFSCILGLLYITLSSDIDGAAHHGHGDITGAPYATVGHCQTSSCHGPNNSANVVVLQVLDTTTMLPITQYHAGHTYLVSLKGDATAVTTNLPNFGFMVSAVSGSHTLSGTYTIPATLSSQIHTFPCGGTTVVECSLSLGQTIAGTNKYATQFYWTAPSTFSDSVSFYSLLNAVDGNGGKSGDYPNAAPRVTIYEYATDAVATTAVNNYTIYPNPATTQLTITSHNTSADINIFNLSGQLVFTHHSYTDKTNIDISTLPAGTYIIRINNTWTTTLLKQ